VLIRDSPLKVLFIPGLGLIFVRETGPESILVVLAYEKCKLTRAGVVLRHI
jgi:hypothetical protein